MRTRVVVLFVALLLAAAAAARADRSEDTPLRASLATLPIELTDWKGLEDPPLSKEVLNVLRADDYLIRTYDNPKRGVVGLYVGFWKSQRQGDTIHSPLNCLPGAGWEPVSQTHVKFTEAFGVAHAGATANRMIIQNGPDRQLVYYWYQSHGRAVASEYRSRLFLVADAVRTHRTDGAIVRVIAPIRADTASAEQQADRDATAFIKRVVPELDRLLPR
jgi:EpsI family protein